jgi:hypothetical protein
MSGRVFDHMFTLDRSRFIARDEMICFCLRAWGQRYVNWVPSLVQHAGIKSLMGHYGKRQSPTFVDPELDGYPAPELLDTGPEICRKLKIAYRPPPY